MSHRSKTQNRSWKERAMSLLLSAVLLLGTVPGLTLPSSAHWADEYLDKMVDWGAMRADQTSNPDAPVTRAEFAGVINRAYGYTETGPIPFEDVSVTDWFYDDICIAYTAGYMAGTSPTTASPNDTLTREMAVCILGRNMMMKETPGESLAFTDSRDVSFWAQGMVKTAVDSYIISGYPDNSFGPQDSISRAQMAVLVSQCVGNPVSESGDHELGGVFGNVTITAPNVTLRNTTISGDLYISGGVGLGGIKLENVNVLGRIIVSGTGESEAGDASVVMRNVTANEMLVDNMRNKTVTVRADGITDIAKTVVRTNAYIEDNNTDDKGLMSIELDGESGTRLTLAGRIKEVVDKTPNSYVQVGKGTVAKLTVDEAAVNSTVQLDRNTEVKEMNLDVAANVTGEGDIEKLNVNAPGSVVDMLPDKIYIRPGLTANIAGVIMDHQAAEEGSLDPRLLSGYPAAKDIAPTSFRADFAGNKKGTVYWAVSSITDGSIGEDDLVTPPSYGSKAIRNGSVAAPVGGDEVSAQVTELTVGGSYYLSAILVDDQGNRSPVKVISFSTPDNTVPAFGQGYPYMSFIGKEYPTDAYITAQATVLPTKSCRLYYAVLPQGAAVPTTNELKAAAVSGNLGYGVLDVTKNEELPIIVSRRLEELKDYVLYLWLADIDGVNSSAVIPLAFRTPDVTPPTFVVDPYVNDIQAQSVRLGATLDENGTIFWAVVESGTDYPKPNAQNPADNTPDGKTARLDSDYAKLQVANGMNALVSGRVNATANTEAAINVSGLSAEKAYDFYYMAQDAAGNYTIQVYKLLGGLHTLDNSGPVVRQYFTKYSGLDEAKDPMNDTDIIFEFSENICLTEASGQDLLTLYQHTTDPSLSDAERQSAQRSLEAALEKSFVMYQRVSGIGPQPVAIKRTDTQTDWVIDYSKVQVKSVEGKLQVIFPSDGLQLASGANYYFEISNITDNSIAKNPISPTTVKDDTASNAAGHSVPEFTVTFARVFLTQIALGNGQWPDGVTKVTEDPENGIYKYNVDYAFRMIPDATHSVEDSMAYDLLLWTDSTMMYDLYYRAIDADGNPKTKDAETDDLGNPTNQYALPNIDGTKADSNGWVKLGSSGEILTNGQGKGLFGKSLNRHFNGSDSNGFPQINLLDDTKATYYEFAISITSLGNAATAKNPKTWSGNITMHVDAAASTSGLLYNLSTSMSESSWNTFVNNGPTRNGGYSIGSTDNPDNPKRLTMTVPFSDSLQPSFAKSYPDFDPTSNSVIMNLALDRAGTVYYAIAPADRSGQELPGDDPWVPVIITMVDDGSATGEPINQKDVPESGDDYRNQGTNKITLKAPTRGNIFDPSQWSEASEAITGSMNYQDVANTEVEIKGLDPDRTYYVYFTITGSARDPSDVEIFKFKTKPTPRPKIELSSGNGGVNMTISNMDAKLTYLTYLKDDMEKIMYTYEDENGAEQTQKFVDMTLKELAEEGVDVPSGYQNMKVLQALRTTYGSSNEADPNIGYSLFDIYASVDAKKKLVDWITDNTLPEGMTSDGRGSAQHEVRDMRQEVSQLGGTNSTPGSDYYILTIARGANTTGREPIETIYSFRALPYIITDRKPPNLNSATATVDIDDSSKYITGGTITLEFDKELYNKDATAKIVDEVGFFGSDRDEVASVSVVAGKDTAIVTIKLNSLRTDELTLTVPGQFLANSGGAVAPESLSITVTRKQSGMMPDGTTPIWGYYINVLWGGANKLVGGPDKPVRVN